MCQQNRISTHTKKILLIFKSSEIFYFISLTCTAGFRRESGSFAPQWSIKHVKGRNQARTQGTATFLLNENWKSLALTWTRAVFCFLLVIFYRMYVHTQCCWHSRLINSKLSQRLQAWQRSGFQFCCWDDGPGSCFIPQDFLLGQVAAVLLPHPVPARLEMQCQILVLCWSGLAPEKGGSVLLHRGSGATGRQGTPPAAACHRKHSHIRCWGISRTKCCDMLKKSY